MTITGVTSLAFQASTSIRAVVEGTGDFSPEVTWSIRSGGGQLSAATGQTVTYTAPLVSEETPVTLYAVSREDSSKVGVFTLMVTAPPPTSQFLAGDYAGTESKSSQGGDEHGRSQPPDNVTQETTSRTFVLTRESDTQLRLSYSGWQAQNFLVDVHEDGTLTIADQDSGFWPEGRCGSSFRIGMGARTGSGTWDYSGHLTLSWSSRNTRSCSYNLPVETPPTYVYHEHLVTAVKASKTPPP